MLRKTSTVLILSMILSSCGGGGSSSSTPIPEPDPEPNPQPQQLALLPAGSEQAFTNYLKIGLEQWSGVSENSTFVEETLFSEDAMTRAAVASAAVDSSTAAVAEAASADSVSGGFSQTNNLVKGVDEIDTIKYNGEYLFLANRGHVQVLKTSNDSAAELVASIGIAEESTGNSTNNVYSLGLFLFEGDDNSILADIRNDQNSYYGIADIAVSDTFFAPWGWDGKTVIDFFDVSNPATISKTNELTLDGSYLNSRRIGDKIYIITRFTPSLKGLIPFAKTEAEIQSNQALLNDIDINTVLPRLQSLSNDSIPLVSTDACFVPNLEDNANAIYYPTITTITAIDMLDPTSFESLCLTGGINGIHVSEDAIYLAAQKYTSDELGQSSSETIIHKFGIGLTELQNSRIAYIGSGSVEGFFWGDPKFLMGEHEDNLTVVTTLDTPDQEPRFNHRLSILGESSDAFILEELSHIPNDLQPETIGKPNELIYASRIVGNRAFLVTFQQTDPVYVIDLSTPTNPQILGELEIPGFSTYLHPVSEGLLLGIGKDTKTVDGFPYFQGLNVRLFDVSDPSNLSVISDIKIGKRGTDSDVFWDSHAFTFLRGEAGQPHRLAIPVTSAGLEQKQDDNQPAWQYYPWSEEALYLFEINHATSNVDLNLTGKIIAQNLESGQVWQPGCCNWNDRAIIDGERLHFLHDTRLISTQWDSPESVSNVFIPTVFPDPFQPFCTEELRNGLEINVFDRDNFEFLRCVTVKVSDGDTSQDLIANCSLGLDFYERAGVFDLDVSHRGYLPWQKNDLRIQEDQCHVQSTYINVFLVPE